MFYVDVIKMEISCLSAGKSCEVSDLCASFRACAVPERIVKFGLSGGESGNVTDILCI